MTSITFVASTLADEDVGGGVASKGASEKSGVQESVSIGLAEGDVPDQKAKD